MKKFIIIFCFFISTIKGQKPNEIYSVSVGDFKCSPDFFESKLNSNGLLSPTDESKLTDNPPIKFPPRSDTVLFMDSEHTKPYEKIKLIDSYDFYASIDSILTKQVDSLIKSPITITCNGKELKLISYEIELVYKDGRRKIIPSKNKHLMDNKDFSEATKVQKDLLYIGIFEIVFKKKRRQRLTIYSGFGWKIK